MYAVDDSIIPADHKVLLVDDDRTTRAVLATMLKEAGYPVRTAADGLEAIEAIELECPDFLVTDWQMPRLDGRGLCRQVRQMRLPHYVCILFVSASGEPDELRAGLESGADQFLSKPVQKEEMLARLRAGARVLRLDRRLRQMAHTDWLTGLLTQGSFYQSLEREWRRSTRLGLPLSCVMMDLDFFKHINDVHGHPAGDSVLKFVAELLLDASRGSDTVCRYGGEEFAVMLPETGESQAAAWAERVRARLSALRIPVGTGAMQITGSFGAAELCGEMRTSEALVDCADQALLCAKRMGRDRVICYGSLADAAQSKFLCAPRGDEVFGDILARDVMSPLLISLRAGQTIQDAVQFFLRWGLSSTPVLGAEGELAGLLSEKDLMAALVSPDCWRWPLSRLMRTNVVCYDEQTPVRVIYDFLCRVSIGGVVVTCEGRPAGTISRSSLLRWFHQWIVGRGMLPSGGFPLSLPEGGTPGTASAPGPRIPDSARAVLPVG